MKRVNSQKINHPNEWQLQEAMHLLSQVVDLAQHAGPQTITFRGKPKAVIISFNEYKNKIEPKKTLAQFFSESPLCGVDIDLNRSNDLPRELDL